jgi:hypothetical protein
MLRKLILFLTPFLVLAIIFLVVVLFINRDNGKGAFQVSSNQVSQVFLNSRYVGNTPLCLCDLPKLIKNGDYDVKLTPTSTGYKSMQQKVTIYDGVLTFLDTTFDKNSAASSQSLITLEPIEDKNDSQILIVSFPDKAQVYLDSVYKGNTPILLKRITASDHEIKILKDGYGSKDLRIKTILGKRLNATITLGIKKDISQPSASASPSAAPTLTKVLILSTPTGFLRVRSEPSVSAGQVGTVSPGNVLNLLSESEGWFQIQLPNGESGWVSSDYAKKQ